jgi:hypothetical protein
MEGEVRSALHLVSNENFSPTASANAPIRNDAALLDAYSLAVIDAEEKSAPP